MNIKLLFTYVLILPVIFVAACTAPATPQASISPTMEVPAAKETPTRSTMIEVPPTETSITHTDIPLNLPAASHGIAADFDSSNVLQTGSLIGGDRFTFGRFERPFNANTMDIYFPEIDIIKTQVFQDDTWLYGRLFIKDLAANSTNTAKYAIEIDTTLNGKANWLILSTKPNSIEWNVAGVQIYKDSNGDVGGKSPYLTDRTLPDGDGFETLVFDQGKGDDTDAAWVRLSPNDPNTIEFAIKRTVLENPTQFMVNMWAGYTLDPGWFDINDHYTHEEAGAADAGQEYFYPIKAVAEVDNSCRIAVGFQPTGTEPGLCSIPKPIANEEDTEVIENACPGGLVQKCDPLEGCWCE